MTFNKKKDRYSFADRVVSFNRSLEYTADLPKGISLMNPFRENEEVLAISEAFYRKYYDDHLKRKLILGINPGRLGAGATGIPFTDTKRLEDICGIHLASFKTHEPSSVFIYELIREYGGPEIFYRHFFINSMSPLGLLTQNKKGNMVNCNYYDDPDLYKAMRPFIMDNLKKLIGLGVESDVCYVLGKKNAKFLNEINREASLFGKLVILDHPRYIVQYRSKYISNYVNEYLKVISN